MKNNQYIQIQGWMVNELKLKANEMMVYAIIYGFSQDGESEFSGGLKYLCRAINASRPTARKALKGLMDKKLIEKIETVSHGVHFNSYKALLRGVKKLSIGSKETLHSGGKEPLPNITTSINTSNRETAFFKLFNDLKEKKNGKPSRLKTLSPADKKNFKALHHHSIADFKIVINTMLESDWPRRTNNQTPSHILRVENFNRYLSNPILPKEEQNMDEIADGMVKEEAERWNS